MLSTHRLPQLQPCCEKLSSIEQFSVPGIRQLVGGGDVASSLRGRARTRAVIARLYNTCLCIAWTNQTKRDMHSYIAPIACSEMQVARKIEQFHSTYLSCSAWRSSNLHCILPCQEHSENPFALGRVWAPSSPPEMQFLTHTEALPRERLACIKRAMQLRFLIEHSSNLRVFTILTQI